MIQRCEGNDQAREAIRLANRIRVSVCANGCCQLQVRADFPFILEVDTHTVNGERVSWEVGKVLRVRVARRRGKQSVGEVRQISKRQGSELVEFVSVIGNVIAAEVDPNFESVVAAINGRVVQNLVLGDIASLREGRIRLLGASVRFVRLRCALSLPC